MTNALFGAWRPESLHEGWRPVGRLEHDNSTYRYFYTQGAKKPGFRPFDHMEAFDQVYESDELFPVFANRLLPSTRPEYDEFLRWGGFDRDHPPDPIVILGLTEGRRQTDAIEVFPCPKPDDRGNYFNKFFLHGIRWLGEPAAQRIARLQDDEPLKVMFDVQNDHDANAVAVRTEDDRVLIGYFPRYLAADAKRLLASCDSNYFSLVVDRVNPDAPLQNRVLCRMAACWPHDFSPCGGEDFEPIPANIKAAFLQ